VPIMYGVESGFKVSATISKCFDGECQEIGDFFHYFFLCMSHWRCDLENDLLFLGRATGRNRAIGFC
jgi:hypothetical protein